MRRVRAGEELAGQVHLVLLDERPARLEAFRAEEREHHPAADDEPVDPRQEIPQHVDLPGDLGPAQDGRERPLRSLEELP